MDNYYSPTIFELIACDRLKSGLREALQYLLENLYQLERFRRLPIPPADETIFLIDIIIEYSYLRTYNASYAENLYNLIRLSPSSGTKSKRILPSLLCLTLVPYLKRKLDKYFGELNYSDSKTDKDAQVIRVYKLMSKSCSLLNLVCLLRYSAGISSYHTLLDGISDITLKGRHEELDQDTNLTLADNVSKGIAEIMGRSLTIGSYIIQFLDYWNTHSNSTPILNASLPIPEPPSKDDIAHTDERSSKLCLICLEGRQNECALSNTGYVFCYKCLHRYVATKQSCPVTGHPTTMDNIVKLFTSTPF